MGEAVGPEARAGAMAVALVSGVPGASGAGVAVPPGGDESVVDPSPAIGGRENCDACSGWRTGAVGATRVITSQAASSRYGAG